MELSPAERRLKMHWLINPYQAQEKTELLRPCPQTEGEKLYCIA